MGVRIYNTAVLRAGERRLEVVTTDDREIALGVLRLLRQREVVICFATGHGEYDIDNFEFHTHFEGAHSHSHNAAGMAVVQMEQHGLGRLRRCSRSSASSPARCRSPPGRPVPADCAALVEANPRTRYSPGRSRDAARAIWSAAAGDCCWSSRTMRSTRASRRCWPRAGSAVGDGVIVDPTEHYFTDEQMIAVTRYGRHPVTRGLALSFYPGARPVETVPATGATGDGAVRQQRDSYVIANRLGGQTKAKRRRRARSRIWRVAAEGRLAAATASAVPPDRGRRRGLRQQFVFSLSGQRRRRCWLHRLADARGTGAGDEAAGRGACRRWR